MKEKQLKIYVLWPTIQDRELILVFESRTFGIFSEFSFNYSLVVRVPIKTTDAEDLT